LRHGLPKQTKHTITTRSALYDKLEEVRQRGYAINDEERIEGLRAVGTIVSDSNGNLIGALTISGLSYRMPNEMIHHDLIGSLQESVSLINERMNSESERTDQPNT
jgi:DNA-binding IclR family transcriptional regulator